MRHPWKFLKFSPPDLLVDGPDLGLRDGADRWAASRTGLSQSNELLDLPQREPERLRPLHEAHQAHRIRRVLPVPRRQARRLAQQSAPLVVAQCLDVYAGAGRHLADGESLGTHLSLRAQHRPCTMVQSQGGPPAMALAARFGVPDR
jgi:hypothetical protein